MGPFTWLGLSSPCDMWGCLPLPPRVGVKILGLSCSSLCPLFPCLSFQAGYLTELLHVAWLFPEPLGACLTSWGTCT